MSSPFGDPDVHYCFTNGECNYRGVCDVVSTTCKCFSGYSGSYCQLDKSSAFLYTAYALCIFFSLVLSAVLVCAARKAVFSALRRIFGCIVHIPGAFICRRTHSRYECTKILVQSSVYLERDMLIVCFFASMFFIGFSCFWYFISLAMDTALFANPLWLVGYFFDGAHRVLSITVFTSLMLFHMRTALLGASKIFVEETSPHATPSSTKTPATPSALSRRLSVAPGSLSARFRMKMNNNSTKVASSMRRTIAHANTMLGSFLAACVLAACICVSEIIRMFTAVQTHEENIEGFYRTQNATVYILVTSFLIILALVIEVSVWITTGCHKTRKQQTRPVTALQRMMLFCNSFSFLLMVLSRFGVVLHWIIAEILYYALPQQAAWHMSINYVIEKSFFFASTLSVTTYLFSYYMSLQAPVNIKKMKRVALKQPNRNTLKIGQVKVVHGVPSPETTHTSSPSPPTTVVSSLSPRIELGASPNPLYAMSFQKKVEVNEIITLPEELTARQLKKEEDQAPPMPEVLVIDTPRSETMANITPASSYTATSTIGSNNASPFIPLTDSLLPE